MPDSISLFRTLETPVSWRTNVCPCMLLTAGMANKVKLQLRESPDSRETPELSAGGITISFYEIPVNRPIPMEAVKATINAGDREILVTVTVPNHIKRGYYKAQVIRWEGTEDNIVDIYEMWMIVNKKVKPELDKFLSVDSVRLQFADVCSLDNKMLESLEISSGDIASAVCRCLEQWADTAPRVSAYLGSTFPYPEHLRNGVLYMMIQMLWTFLERNRMSYNAGGVQVDLEKRADSFRLLKEEYEKKWQLGMSQAKMEENLMGFYASLEYM